MEYSYKNLDRRNTIQYAYIVDSGNFELDFQATKTSSHFLVTAVICDEYKIQDLEAKLEIIFNNYFNTDISKALHSSITDEIRIKLLEDLSKLDFNIFSLIIDKRNLYTEGGLQYKGSFVKFLNEMLHRELYTAYPKLQMTAKDYEDREFMKGFIKYVENNHQPTLFEVYDFSFSNNKSERLLQLAEIINDTLSIGYEKDIQSSKFNTFMKLIKNKIAGLRVWPETYRNYLVSLKAYKNIQYDELILEQGVRLADRYINENKHSEDSEIQTRVLFLKFLKSMLFCQRPDQYISTKEILYNLNMLRKDNFTSHYFRTKVVAKLRDEGVLIASSPSGYKLPISVKEVYDFVNQSSTVITPMLNRLKKCREQIKSTTKNQLDILDRPEYVKLKSYFGE